MKHTTGSTNFTFAVVVPEISLAEGLAGPPALARLPLAARYTCPTATAARSVAASEAPYEDIIMRPSGSPNAAAREMARYLRMNDQPGHARRRPAAHPGTTTRMEPPPTPAAREGITGGDGLGNTTVFVNGHHLLRHARSITGFGSRERVLLRTPRINEASNPPGSPKRGRSHPVSANPDRNRPLSRVAPGSPPPPRPRCPASPKPLWSSRS